MNAGRARGFAIRQVFCYPVFGYKKVKTVWPNLEPSPMVEPYFTSKTSGCGLGLAVSKGIVEAHGGRINIEAVDEVILRVMVELPVKKPF